MKRIAQILIIMSLLIVPTFSSNVNSSSVNTINQLNNERIQSISLDQGDLIKSRPILEEVYNSTTTPVLLPTTRDRNDSQGHGAIHETILYQNITVQYRVVNGDEDTTVKLYLDAPAMNITEQGANYSLKFSGNENESIVMKYISSSAELENITLPYDKGLGELVHVNISTYEAEFNMTSNFVKYFAAVDELNHETLLNAPFNFVTTQQYWTTKSIDEFYIQTEFPEINIVANNTTVDDVFGISYRTSPTGQFTRVNFTTPVTAPDFEDNITLPTFNLGVVVEWFSYVYMDDVINGTPTLTLVDKLEYKRVKMEDGTPSLHTEIGSSHPERLIDDNTLYSQTNDVDFAISATVVKGQIKTFNLTLGTNITIVNLDLNANISKEGDFFNFTHPFEVGTHDVLISAFTDKDIEINATYTVVIDKTIPTISQFQEEFEQTVIYSTSRKVTFKFNFSDDLSGVREAFIDWGDGVTEEVTNVNEATHTYRQFRELGYRISLEVRDYAGNHIVSEVIQVRILAEPIGDTSSPITEFWILLFVVIVAIVGYRYREKIGFLNR